MKDHAGLAVAHIREGISLLERGLLERVPTPDSFAELVESLIVELR